MSSSRVAVEIQEAFYKYDANRSGKLNVPELRNALRALGVETTSQEASNILSKYDTDRNGLLDMDEFDRLVSEPPRRY